MAVPSAGGGATIISLTPAADYTTKKGYTVTFSSDTATVSNSATVVASGVITEGNETTAGYATEKVSVAMIGAGGTAYVRLSGTVTKGAYIQQSTDGTCVTDAGSGNRVIVGTALESGVTGENIRVALGRIYYAS